MHDVKDVLEQALDNLPSTGATADPGPDLARGRSLLRRRRKLRAAGVTAVCAVAAIALVPIAVRGPAARPATTASHGTRGDAMRAVRLVAYTGAQPPGYTVQEIPTGWVIQGSNPYILVIAPANDPDKNPDSFLGKLVVSSEATSLGVSGTRVSVGRDVGYYSEAVADGILTQTLDWKQAKNRWMSVEATASLHWNASELARFAAGVTVLATAKPSVG